MANSNNSSEHQTEINNQPASTSYIPSTQPVLNEMSPNSDIREGELCRITESLTLQKTDVHYQSIGSQKDAPQSTKLTFTKDSKKDGGEVSKIAISNRAAESSTPGPSKKKNAKKKERLKQLHMPQPSVAPNQPQTAPAAPTALSTPPDYLFPNNITVQELFTYHIGPMYANTGSLYLENLSHHPQYRLMHNMKMREIFQQHPQSVASAPSSPLVPQPYNNPGHASNSIHQQMDPRTPKYLQNVMQHPLLNKSYSAENYNQFQRQQLNPEMHAAVDNTEEPATPRRKRRSRTKSKDGNADKKFGMYMHIKDVEMGLKNNTLIEGVIRINPKQFTHAYVSSNDRDEQDILLDGIKNRNRALEGDIVVVEIIHDNTNDNNEDDDLVNGKHSAEDVNPDAKIVNPDVENVLENDAGNGNPDKQRRGRVVYIKEKVHNRTCIGVMKLMPDRNRQKALFVPRDHRLPRLNIPFTSWPDNFYQDAQNYENTLFLAKIIDWFDLRFATGKIIQSIGQSGDIVTETIAILAQTDLDVTPLGREYRHLYPRLDYKIPEEEILLREDCRNICVFSIDPSNCRDIDDAVSCRKLDNGNYEVGVHISDVAFFLTENTELDEKVAEKATTIYLVDKAYHMLPDELCMLCSLFPGVDKLAFSVFWEINDNAEVLSHRFAKTVIQSCCQLAYEHAQAILEDKEDAETIFPETYNGFQYKDMKETIKILGKIGAKFRQNRFDNGALRIDQPKVAFHLDPFNGLPKSFWIYESKESHQLIEEFMLLANMTVAARIYKDHPKLSFLRCHPPPSGYMLKQLAKSLKPMGIELNIDTAGNLHRSMLPYVGPDSTDKGRAMVLSMLCAKPMARAKYFCVDGVDDDDFHHYALNVPLYTHFTSPIRRYADIIVHRLLAASLNYRSPPEWEVDRVRLIAAQCNKQKYNAKKAGELSTELYTLKYIEMHSPIMTEAVVVDVREKYLDVIIVAMGLNRRVYFNNDFPGDFKCVKSDAGAKMSRMEVEWHNRDEPQAPKVKQIIEVFSIVQIEMIKGNEMVKVETKLVKPGDNIRN